MHEKKIGQKLRNWKFYSFDQSSIDRIPIKPGRFKLKILMHFRSVDRQIRSIENLENFFFLKNGAILCRNSSKHSISWMKCMSMKLKVFKNHLNSTQIFQKQVFQPICLQNSNIKLILHQNQGTCNLVWSLQIYTHYHVLSLANNNLCNVCN